MGVADVTDPEAVRAAIHEYREIGKKAFLDRYGFGPARDWVVRYDGEEFDSKAIVGAAHGYQYPDRGPLTSSDFTGGRATVVAKLKALGFEVESLTSEEEEIAFTAEDCSLFEKYPRKVPFKDDVVPPPDKARFKDIWVRLKGLAAGVATAAEVDIPLRSEASLYSQNGYSQTDLWSCAYPRSVPNKSYGLQIAFILSAEGAELCFCLGAGQSQISDESRRKEAEASFARLREALRATPEDVREIVRRNLRPEWALRRRWRESAGTRDFDDLDAWLAHAAGPEGHGASVSLNLTPAQLEDLGTGVGNSLLSLAEAFSPLLSYAYGETSSSALTRALNEYEAEVDREELERTRTALDLARSRFDDLFGSAEKVDRLSAEALFGFLNDLDHHVSPDTGLFTLGPGLPAPKDPGLQTWTQLEEDLPKLREALKKLLHEERPLPDRIDAMLEGERPRRYITPELALPTILLVLADPDAHSGVQRMPKKEEKLRAMDLVPGLPRSATIGERFVAYEAALARVPAQHGKAWDWAMRDGFYWSAAFERNLVAPKEGRPEDGSSGGRRPAIDDLAASLYLEGDGLEEVVHLLEEKGQVIFYGPPGTGKTYTAQKLGEWLAPEQDQIEIVQFHPSYSYEDFVQGFRPFLTERKDLAYHLQRGPLLRLAARAAADPDRRFVLLIDEINRGNLPRIFGELLYLLEYRDQRVTLTYAPPPGMRSPDDPLDEEGRFALPSNLWLIGTMNTADRSIGLIDAALRRRFHFVPFFPNEGLLEGVLRRWLEDKQPPDMRSVGDWVDRLNALLSDRFGRHLQVGHSYFMRPVLTQDDVERIWATDIMPFLEDQLFDQEAQLKQYTLDAIRSGEHDAAQSGEASALQEEDLALAYADDPTDGA